MTRLEEASVEEQEMKDKNGGDGLEGGGDRGQWKRMTRLEDALVEEQEMEDENVLGTPAGGGRGRGE